MKISCIQAWYQNPKKHLILAQFTNSPWTGYNRRNQGSAGEAAKSRRLRIQSINRVFALTLTFRLSSPIQARTRSAELREVLQYLQ